MPDESEVKQASDAFYAATNAVLTGELQPMDDIWSHGSDVTNVSPIGGRTVGWKAVRAEYEAAAAVKSGGRVEVRDLLVRAGDSLAFTLCVEEWELPGGESVKVAFHATSIFRCEEGRWRLVHHHTDAGHASTAKVRRRRK